MDSILSTIKKMLGIDSDYDVFDVDIITLINSALMVLNQIGVGNDKSFSIEDASATWADYLGEDLPDFQSVKNYIYLKVKTVFDPPANSFVQTSFEEQIKEIEWRLNMQAEVRGDVSE